MAHMGWGLEPRGRAQTGHVGCFSRKLGLPVVSYRLLTSFLKESLRGRDHETCRGSGREYLATVAQRLRNHEEDPGLRRLNRPILWRGLEGPRLATMDRRENCLMWRVASPGRTQERKLTAGIAVPW